MRPLLIPHFRAAACTLWITCIAVETAAEEAEPIEDPSPAVDEPQADSGEQEEAATPEGDDQSSTGEVAPEEASERGVLRFGSVELSPDLKLYADSQIDVASENVDNAFHLARAYLGLRAQITSWLYVTYDISQVTDVGRSGSAEVVDGEAVVDASRLEGSLVARLKYAYLNLGIDRLSLAVQFGVIHTPWIGWVESVEGTRFLRKVMIENEYGYPSADFGVVLAGHVLGLHAELSLSGLAEGLSLHLVDSFDRPSTESARRRSRPNRCATPRSGSGDPIG
jgi:hypothetical protein